MKSLYKEPKMECDILLLIQWENIIKTLYNNYLVCAYKR